MLNVACLKLEGLKPSGFAERVYHPFLLTSLIVSIDANTGVPQMYSVWGPASSGRKRDQGDGHQLCSPGAGCHLHALNDLQGDLRQGARGDTAVTRGALTDYAQRSEPDQVSAQGAWANRHVLSKQSTSWVHGTCARKQPQTN